VIYFPLFLIFIVLVRVVILLTEILAIIKVQVVTLNEVRKHDVAGMWSR
jgi:hypothetical protein